MAYFLSVRSKLLFTVCVRSPCTRTFRSIVQILHRVPLRNVILLDHIVLLLFYSLVEDQVSLIIWGQKYESGFQPVASFARYTKTPWIMEWKVFYPISFSNCEKKNVLISTQAKTEAHFAKIATSPLLTKHKKARNENPLKV